MAYNKVIVADFGTKFTKFGFANNKKPEFIIQSILGRHKYNKNMNEFFDETRLKPLYSIEPIIERGVITNWNNFELLLDNIFNKYLKVDPSEHPILLTDRVQNPNREKTLEIFFEKYNIKSALIGPQPLFSLYSANKTTGSVIEIGEGVTQFYSIYQDDIFSQVSSYLNLGGQDHNDILLRNINSENINVLRSPSEKDNIRFIKEKHAYAPINSFEIKNDVIYTLDDGTTIIIPDEILRDIEFLFNPKIIGCSSQGIHRDLINIINRCDSDYHQAFYSNIVFTGGPSLLNGACQCLKNEILRVAPETMDINIIQPDSKKYSAWLGASLLTQYDIFNERSIKLNEYKECGSKIVQQRCI